MTGLQLQETGVYIRTTGEPLRADKVVLAAGAFSHRIAATLGERIPLETERGYNTTLPPGALDLRCQVTFGGHGFVVTRLSTGIRVGGAVELGGLSLPPNYKRSEAMLRKAKAFLPGLKTEGGTQWMGFRPSLPDSLPAIGRAKASPHVLYAFGHGHLGLTQSAVSHALDKLRALTGDALFVRSGRGIVATAQADALVPRARALLDELRAFSHAAGFDPTRWEGTITVAANDLQRDLLVPPLLARLQSQCPGVRLRVWPSQAPRPELLRDQGCDLVVTPRPPEAADLVQKRLFTDRYAVFYDPACRPAPAGLDDYLGADHVTVVYHPHRLLAQIGRAHV